MTNHYLRRTLAVLPLAAVVACSRVPLPPPSPPPPPPEQVAGSTIAEGDSVSWQYVNGGGQEDWPDVEFHVGPGDSLATCYKTWNPDCTTSRWHVEDAVANGVADRVYLAHGANDSSTTGLASDGLADGWSDVDVIEWTNILDNVIPEASCVVVQLPWIEAPQPAANVAQVAEARAWLTAAVETRENVHLIDWEPYFHRPSVAMYDGAHLKNVEGGRTIFDTLGHVTTIEDLTPEARQARIDVMTDGLALC